MRYALWTFFIGVLCVLLLLAWEMVLLPKRGLESLLWGGQP